MTTADPEPLPTPEQEGASPVGGLGYAAVPRVELELELERLDPGRIWLGEPDRPTLADIVSLALEAGVTSLDVELDGYTAHIGTSAAGDGSESPIPAPLLPVQRRERLPWTSYTEPLRDALKALVAIYPPEAVADAAAELELLVALHGRPRPASPHA